MGFNMEHLSTRQREVLNFIREKQIAGISPTYREISSHFGFSSPNAAMQHVKALLSKGYLRRTPGRARTMQAVERGESADKPRPRMVVVPIYGTIPAGFPDIGDQEDEGCVLIDVDTLGIRPTSRTFGLKVRGDSMIGKHIMDGDIAIIEHGIQARNGDVVAALIDGQVTLKTFVIQRNRLFLRAENPKYPELIPQDDLQIQGVLTTLIRKRQTGRR